MADNNNVVDIEVVFHATTDELNDAAKTIEGMHKDIDGMSNLNNLSKQAAEAAKFVAEEASKRINNYHPENLSVPENTRVIKRTQNAISESRVIHDLYRAVY